MKSPRLTNPNKPNTGVSLFDLPRNYAITFPESCLEDGFRLRYAPGALLRYPQYQLTSDSFVPLFTSSGYLSPIPEPTTLQKGFADKRKGGSEL